MQVVHDSADHICRCDQQIVTALTRLVQETAVHEPLGIALQTIAVHDFLFGQDLSLCMENQVISAISHPRVWSSRVVQSIREGRQNHAARGRIEGAAGHY
eukprot:Skav203566  [mRNA]  locus=scaffold3576:204326:208112:- [translate_table: standard]